MSRARWLWIAVQGNLGKIIEVGKEGTALPNGHIAAEVPLRVAHLMETSPELYEVLRHNIATVHTTYHRKEQVASGAVEAPTFETCDATICVRARDVLAKAEA